MTVALAVLTTLAVLLTATWLTPQLCAWVSTGHTGHLGYWRAQALLAHLLLAPRHARGDQYPAPIHAAMRNHPRFAGILLLTILCEASLIVGAILRFDRTTSRPMADRRWWDPRGIRPRAFARPHTIDTLLVRTAPGERITVGRYDDTLLAVEQNLQTLVIAAPQTGKTSGIVIPAILEHLGAVINTTVRTDVRDQTITRRQSLGEVFVWDPFGESTDGWDLLHGCQDWAHALRCARWLTSAQSLGEGGNTDYFRLEAEQLLAPLLHTAAISPDRKTMRDVYHWVQTRAEDEPMTILVDADAHDAIRRFQSVYAYNDRQRDGIIGAASAVIAAYGNPGVERTLTAQRMLTPEKLFQPATANTLYIVADREHQRLLAPLVVTLISTLLHHISQIENDYGALRPSCLCALDETANISPLDQLPEILATSLPSVRFLTVWHSVAQMRRAYQDNAAAEILALSQAKVFLGSITDRITVEEVTRLIANRGNDPLTNDELASQALQRTSQHEGLLIHKDMPPAIFRQRRYYNDPTLKSLANAEEPAKHLNPLALLLAGETAATFLSLSLLASVRLAIIASIAAALLIITPLRRSLLRATIATTAVACLSIGLGASTSSPHGPVIATRPVTHQHLP